MPKKQKSTSKTSQIFINEFNILKKSDEFLKDNSIIKNDLLDQYRILNREYKKLLKTAVKITSGSDNYQRKLLNANEQIKEQKIELEKINTKQEQLLKELRESNATKDKFFSIIAHDLRGSFSVLIEGSELLSANISELDNNEIKWIAEQINIYTTNLLKMLENLLHWSRIQMGVTKLKPIKINIDNIVKECIDLLMDQAIRKNILLFHEIDDSIFVYADEDMFNYIIRNLISNAIKFTDKGGEIKITSQVQNKFVELSVIDTGIGIDKNRINDLFRIDKHHTTDGTADEKGSGLGLILCKEFIEKNGGKIWIESNPDKGTLVKFTLPLIK